jgi:hypothetical protein
MRALYLYFAEAADPGRDPSSEADGARLADRTVRPPDGGELVPIRPGAFSRWMASRKREASEAAHAARNRRVVDVAPVRRARPEPAG